MSMGSVGSEKWRGQGNLPVIVMSPNLQFHKYFIQNISKVSKTKYLIPKILESTRYKEVPGIIAVFVVFVHQFSSIILYNPSTLKKVNVDFVRLKFFPQNAQNLFLSWEDEIRWVSAFVKAFVFTRPFVPLYSSLWSLDTKWRELDKNCRLSVVDLHLWWQARGSQCVFMVPWMKTSNRLKSKTQKIKLWAWRVDTGQWTTSLCSSYQCHSVSIRTRIGT